jgi:hypothetical protein
MAGIIGIDTIQKNVTRLAERVNAQVVSSARQQAPLLEAYARRTRKFRDISGATRASTVAVVVTADDSGDRALQTAQAMAEALRPGSTLVEPGPALAANELASVRLTALTRYVRELCVNHAGRKDFLTPSMLTGGSRMVKAIFADVQTLFEG